MTLQKKQNQKNLEEIRVKIDKEYLFEVYGSVYRDILEIRYQNDWLATEDGEIFIGIDKAKEVIETNKKSIKQEQNKLRFIEESLTK